MMFAANTSSFGAAPADRDKLVAADVFKVGVPFIVHRYTDVFPHAMR
jgi:hypothetical protein